MLYAAALQGDIPPPHSLSSGDTRTGASSVVEFNYQVIWPVEIERQ